MDQHYRAFISYKHAPADIAVASEIQKRLERYHVPAEIRKKTGQKSIGRIFRDKEELAITSDLSESISKALEDADYLIVICSTSTKLSTWVSREIDSFLEHHSREQVLTVLVDGEPMDVVPKQLLTSTVTRTNPDGTTYEEEVSYEPLSCDFRSGLKEAKRTEITRLAATLLDCTYDELIRREHQYKRHRNLAIGIPTALFLAIAIGYLVWSRQEIAKNYKRAEENYQLAQENYQKAQENLNQSLINQSSYLASESRKLFEKGDRLRAISIALEALPDKEADPDSFQVSRPVTEEALQALVRALRAYVSEGTIDNNSAITTVAEFSVTTSIKDYKATADGRYVIIRDDDSKVWVWDTTSFSRTMLLDSEKFLDVQLMSNTQMVLLSDKGVVSYDIPSGQELWRVSDQEALLFATEICLSTEEMIVWVGEAGRIMDPYSFNMRLLGIDALSGEIISNTMLVENAEKHVNVQRVACSKDGRWVAVAVEVEYLTPVRIFLFDVEANTYTELSQNRDCFEVDTMAFVEDFADEGIKESKAKRLAVMAYPLEYDGKGGSDLGSLGIIMEPMEIAISCYDLISASSIWENSYFSPQPSKVSKGSSLAFSEETENLISIYGNKVIVIQTSDGKIVDEQETTSFITSMRIRTDGKVRLYLKNGDIGRYSFEDPGQIIQKPYFNFDIRSFLEINQFQEDGQDFLVMPEANCVWLCRAVYDEDFVPITGPEIPEGTYFERWAVVDGIITIIDLDSDDDNHVYLYDISGQNTGKVIDLPGESLGYEVLGRDEKNGIIWLYNWLSRVSSFFAVDVSNGTLEKYQAGNVASSYASPKLLQGGELVYFVNDYPYTQLVAAFIKDGALKETTLLERLGAVEEFFVRPDFKVAILEEYETKALHLVNLKTAEDICLESIFQETMKQVVWQGLDEGEPSKDIVTEEHKLAITDGNEVVILNYDGSETARLSQFGSRVVSMTTYGNELVILFEGGMLTRYNWSDGTMIGASSISHFETEYFNEAVDWNFEGDKLYLIRQVYSRLMYIINLDTWEEEASIQCGMAYDTARDRIITYSKDEEGLHIGYYPHYSVDDLRQKAKEVLHGFQLTDEEREAYGLG